ncbi:MAG: cbb3-type cytochrome c oxidase subunit I [Gammaproteobacteria bacterium]|nr:cbb3-type cytochrome c oxidase subunit I [Gammaproteobacteria bacterium]
MNTFQLEQFSAEQIRTSRRWFFLGVFSLIASGIFSLLLVLSRTPAVSNFIPWIDFFRTALVVHVDLSVLIWFLSFSAMFWSLNNQKPATHIDNLALALTLAGTLLIIITPFSGQAHPVINNYIPVLNDPLFLTGLLLVGLSMVILSLRSLLMNTLPDIAQPQGVIRSAIFLSVITLIFTLLAQLFSYLGLPAMDDPHSYFEFLFWGSGHTLQFSHTLLLLVSWLWLSQASGIRTRVNPVQYSALFVLCFAPVLAVPFIYLNSSILSPEHRMYFTELMRFGGLTAVPLGLLLAANIFVRSSSEAIHRPLRSAFISSVVLFASGGILGFMISGVNVVIPAHYHGSIVGVTLAFMGMSYLLLPVFGYQAPSGKLATYQPMIYATGQMMHIIGLAWSGGYGVQRKTAGAAQGLDTLAQKAGMGLMGLGGLVAIIGGIIFLIIILRAVYRK